MGTGTGQDKAENSSKLHLYYQFGLHGQEGIHDL